LCTAPKLKNEFFNLWFSDVVKLKFATVLLPSTVAEVHSLFDLSAFEEYTELGIHVDYFQGIFLFFVYNFAATRANGYGFRSF